MTINEAIEYITSSTWSQWRLGLERTYELLERVGRPDRQLKFVHVAGTNGKGSTCAMVESMLRAAGYTTGTYPSPYIEDFRERIQVNAEPISEAALCELTEAVKAEAEKMDDHPSQFEIITAIGMLWFAANNCDIVVLEVGLGGVYDSTNIIDPPEAAVITNIGYDHTDYLGNTLAEITGNKCGIIKSGSDVVAYPNVSEVTDVIEAVCKEKGCRLDYADFGRIEPLSADISGQTFLWNNADAEPLEIWMPLIGEYQLRNAATALTVIEALRRRGWDISSEAVIKGMAAVSWPARFEVLGQDPVFILDGGHNRQCAEAVAESLEKYFPGGGLTLITGMLADKDYEAILDVLLPYVAKCCCLTPSSDRALPAEELVKVIKSKDREAEAFESAEEAVAKAISEGAPVIAFGSLYLAGAVRKAYRKVHKEKHGMEDVKEFKRALRKQKIAAREGLSEEERVEWSKEICERVLGTEEYKKANVIFAYKWYKGEVKLDALEEKAKADGKRLVYPLCISKTEMEAIEPSDEDGAWVEGYKGIMEPVREKGVIVAPEEIDLVVAPCSAFDDECRRLGQGGGFYDRYLPKCAGADMIAVAFEVQRAEEIPTDEYDFAVPAVATEKRLIRRNTK